MPRSPSYTIALLRLAPAISPKQKVIAAYLFCALTWGTTWFFIRVSIGPGAFPTYPSAALRFTIAVAIIVLLGLAGLFPLKPHLGSQVRWVCVAGLLNGLGYALVYHGEETVPGSVAAVIFGSSPLLIAICAAITRTERISTGQITGAIIALAGIVFIFWDRLTISPQQAVSVALIFVAALGNAIYVLLLKCKAPDAHSMSATGIFLAGTSAVLWLFSLAAFSLPHAVNSHPLPWPPPLNPSLALLYLAIAGSFLAFGCYLYLIKHVSAMVVGSLVIVQPLIALVVDHFWEAGAKFSALTYTGAALTLTGLIISLLRKPAQPAA